MISKLLKREKINKISNEFSSDNKYAIIVNKLTKKFRHGFVAVDDASFNVTKGSIHGFIGPNGAGKTTTIKCLISAMIINQGQAWINNLPAQSLEAKKLIGYIPENARFPKGISTYNFLVSMCLLAGLKSQEAKVRVEEELKILELWNFKDKSPNSYSSGMKKKVLLIQALINNPKIIIMDEPAANLDPSARTEMFNALKKLKNEGKTIFISSHILSELQDIADEVTILNKGKVVYTGPLKIESEPIYQIKSDENDKLLALIKKHHFKVKTENGHLIINLKHEKQINEIYEIAIKNHITISEFQIKTTNLQQLYEEKVMSEGVK